jgi:drug/metabolite transporter (DMT)-like permease
MFPSQLFSSILSLSSGAAWGAADFSGGVASKRANVLTVVWVAHGTGLLFMAALAIGFREPWPAGKALAWGAAAGLSGAVGLVSLYRSLAIGKMGVNAPVAAVITAVLPVVFGMWTQGFPGALQFAGFALALLAIWLIALPDGELVRPAGLGLATLAGVGFSGFLLFSRLAGTQTVYWPLAASRAASVVLITVLLLTRKPADWKPRAAVVPYMVISGVLDSAGNALFVIATHFGRLDVAAVLSSLYPTSTVLLAWVILKERASRMQLAGLFAAVVAVVLIAWK